MTVVTKNKPSWVLLSYRIPREPSTPRIAVWRKLKDLGVAQIGDGLVALPKTSKTMDRLQWVAATVIEAEGEAIVWTASTAGLADSDRLTASISEARDTEYRALLDAISAADDVGSRTVQRWRRELKRIDRRDYFKSKERDPVRLAIIDRARGTSEIDEPVATRNETT